MRNETLKRIIYPLALIAILLIIVSGMPGCARWEDVRVPPGIIDPVETIDTLYDNILKPQIKANPEAKEIINKILNGFNSKMPRITDGKITVNDAFVEIESVVSGKYKTVATSIKLAFNLFYGDFGKQIPEKQLEKIETIKAMIDRLQGKLAE